MARLARVLEVGDLLAAEIGRFLKGTLPLSTVSRAYVPDVDDDTFDDWIDAQTPLGVFVVPLRKAGETETRSKDRYDFTYSVIFVEKYTGAGVPPTAWLDDRVCAVDDVDEHFGDSRQPFQTESGPVWAESSEIAIVFDEDVLSFNHAFWSAWLVTLREVR